MADASSIRYASSFPSPTNRNKGAVRYDKTNNKVKVSDGATWNSLAYENPPTPADTFQVTYTNNASDVTSTLAQTIGLINSNARLIGAVELHLTKEATATALTMTLSKEEGVAAPGTGVELGSTFNLKGNNSTLQTSTLSTNAETLLFKAGDRVSIKYSGAATELGNVTVTLLFERVASLDVQYTQNPSGSIATAQTIFIAPCACRVTGIQQVHATKTSTAATIQVTKESGTTAPGGGSNAGLLETALSLAATANTVQTGTLATTYPNNLILAAGDRLSVKYSTSATALAGNTVSVTVVPVGTSTVDDVVMYSTLVATDLADGEIFFVAPAPCVVTGALEIHSHTGGSGATVTASKGSTALIQTASDLTATANTVQTGVLATAGSTLLLQKGDVLTTAVAGTLTALTGTAVAVAIAYV